MTVDKDPGALVEAAEEAARDALVDATDDVEPRSWKRAEDAVLRCRAAIARLSRIARLAGRAEQAEKSVVDCPFKVAMHKLERDRLRAELAAQERGGSDDR